MFPLICPWANHNAVRGKRPKGRRAASTTMPSVKQLLSRLIMNMEAGTPPPLSDDPTTIVDVMMTTSEEATTVVVEETTISASAATTLDNENDIALSMVAILGTILAVLAGLVYIQTEKKHHHPSFFPSNIVEPSKRAYEQFTAAYTPVWIAIFGLVVVTRVYEHFTAWSYIQLCGGLALPFLLQPVLWPSAGFDSPDAQRPLHKRYAFKANLWLAIYSFIGNYWYTHYFYSVLKAEYTMPAHRLNNVPIAMYMATHFYFSTYHFFSNALLRKVVTTYERGLARNCLFVSVILGFAYFTAFMETLTISSYPYYSFQDRHMAYTVGSAFYGIYFLVSFPAFFTFDREIDKSHGKDVTVWDTIVSACGHGMIIMFLLDFVRLYLHVPLVIDVAKK